MEIESSKMEAVVSQLKLLNWLHHETKQKALLFHAFRIMEKQAYEYDWVHMKFMETELLSWWMNVPVQFTLYLKPWVINGME